MLYRAGRPVGIKYLQPVTLHIELSRRIPERPGSLLRDDCTGLLVAGDPLTEKVIGGKIPDLLKNPRDIVGQQDKAAGVHGFTCVDEFFHFLEFLWQTTQPFISLFRMFLFFLYTALYFCASKSFSRFATMAVTTASPVTFAQVCIMLTIG